MKHNFNASENMQSSQSNITTWVKCM